MNLELVSWRLFSVRVDNFLRLDIALKMFTNTKIAICPKFRFSLYRGKEKRKLEVIFCLIESPRSYKASREK